MTQTYSKGIINILPVLYICWKDNVLSPSELNIIRSKFADATYLSDEDKIFLLKYLDESEGPSETELNQWLLVLRNNASNITTEEKEDVLSLITKLSKVNLEGNYTNENEAIIASITEVLNVLELNKPQQYISLMNALGLKEFNVKKSASFDSHKLARLIDHKFYDTKKKVKDLLRDNYFDNKDFTDKEVYRLHVLDVVKNLGAQGFGALAFDEKYGGKSSIGDYMAVFETLCYYNMNYGVKLGVQYGLFGGAVYSLGNTGHHDKYIKDIGSGKLLGCFAMTETGHGSNVKDLETTATYNNVTKEITIQSPTFTSGKEYIGNALHGRMAVVFAQLMVENISQGVHAILVPYRDDDGNLLQGIKVEDCGYKLGLNGIDNGRMWFDNVTVPKENLLNRFGDIDENGQYKSEIENPNKRFFTMLGALVGGRISVGLGATSGAKSALAIALTYAHKRRQFAPDDFQEETLLIDYPTHQHRLISLLAKTIVYHNSLTNLATQFATQTEENEIRKIETKAAGLKAMATWLCTKTIQECREACGGKGYLKENRIADLKADSDIFTTFEGDNTVLLQLVAKGLLTEFKQSFNDAGFVSAMRYIGGKIGFTLAELNVYKSRKTDESHLQSEEFLSDALRYREKKMLVSLADRLRSYIKSKTTPHQAFLKCQVHMVDTAKAYVERLAYRDMIKYLATLPPSPEKNILEKINTFYALSVIMDHRYFYLESDFMDGSKTKAIRKVYSKLMKELSDESMNIIAAFELPRELVEVKR
jgi:acyl-CoA oxidase